MIKMTKGSIKRIARTRRILSEMHDGKGLYELLDCGPKTKELLDAAFGIGRWKLFHTPVTYGSPHPGGGGGSYSGNYRVIAPSMETIRDFLHAVRRKEGTEYHFSKFERRIHVDERTKSVYALYQS